MSMDAQEREDWIVDHVRRADSLVMEAERTFTAIKKGTPADELEMNQLDIQIKALLALAHLKLAESGGYP